MISMMLYGISVLFTPGPVTLLSVNQGFKKRFLQSKWFYFGVGLATFLLFLIYGYTGEKFIKEDYLFYISIIGSLYILFLSIKIFRHPVDLRDSSESTNADIGFRDGFLMQFFNPKASLVALPVASINFPANNITGMAILSMSLIFFFLAILSPALYCFSGQFLSRYICNVKLMNAINKSLALILAFVGLQIFMEHVLSPLLF